MSAYEHGKIKQDLPPPGGYEEINYKRVPIQRILGYKTFFAASGIMTLYGYFYYRKRKEYMRKLKADYLDHAVAVEPLMLAEMDRAFLRHLRHNRNVERDLMKNVDHWEVGTLYGSKVYKNIPQGALPTVSFKEFHAHRFNRDVIRHYKPNYDIGFEDNDIHPQY